jgi:hypothetical protein
MRIETSVVEVAEVIEVIAVRSRTAKRVVVQYFTLDGALLAESEPMFENDYE